AAYSSIHLSSAVLSHTASSKFKQHSQLSLSRSRPVLHHYKLSNFKIFKTMLALDSSKKLSFNRCISYGDLVIAYERHDNMKAVK
ncbi:hypothetical protein TorRG33x02_356780, partial [Trema orientale]